MISLIGTSYRRFSNTPLHHHYFAYFKTFLMMSPCQSYLKAIYHTLLYPSWKTYRVPFSRFSYINYTSPTLPIHLRSQNRLLPKKFLRLYNFRWLNLLLCTSDCVLIGCPDNIQKLLNEGILSHLSCYYVFGTVQVTWIGP
jgi:hypothetical protein